MKRFLCCVFWPRISGKKFRKKNIYVAYNYVRALDLALELQKAAMSMCFPILLTRPCCPCTPARRRRRRRPCPRRRRRGRKRPTRPGQQGPEKERGLFKTGNNSSTFGYNGVVEHKAPPSKVRVSPPGNFVPALCIFIVEAMSFYVGFATFDDLAIPPLLGYSTHCGLGVSRNVKY